MNILEMIEIELDLELFYVLLQGHIKPHYNAYPLYYHCYYFNKVKFGHFERGPSKH